MNIQDKALSIGKYGCLAFCYLYCLGIEGDDTLKYISMAIENGLLYSDCTVKDANKFLKFFSGRDFIVTKKDIVSIKDIKEMTPVRFDNGASSHWVVVENGEIVFNSLDVSNCVNNGIPTTCRILKYK